MKFEGLLCVFGALVVSFGSHQDEVCTGGSDGPCSDKEEGTGSWAPCLLPCRIGLCSVFTPKHDTLRAVFVGKQAPALSFPILEIHGHSSTAAQSVFVYIVYGPGNNGKSLGPETWKEWGPNLL